MCILLRISLKPATYTLIKLMVNHTNLNSRCVCAGMSCLSLPAFCYSPSLRLQNDYMHSTLTTNEKTMSYYTNQRLSIMNAWTSSHVPSSFFLIPRSFLRIMTIHDHREFGESNRHHKTLMSASWHDWEQIVNTSKEANKQCVIVAHRLRVAKDCLRIFVLGVYKPSLRNLF